MLTQYLSLATLLEVMHLPGWRGLLDCYFAQGFQGLSPLPLEASRSFIDCWSC